MTQGKRIPALDGIRAIAIVAVVAYHAHVPLTSGGFTGVDMFFVLSGFLITGVLLDDARAGGISILEFYARRARRLIPALTLMLIAVSAVAWLTVPDVSALQIIGSSTVASSLFAQNIYLLRHAGDYFADPLHANPLLHTWSLSVEEQFYLGWPLAVMLAQRAFSRDPRRGVLVFAVIASAASLLVCMSPLGSPLTNFYAPWSRVWELGAGAILSCMTLPRGRETLFGAIGTVGAISALASLAVLDAGVVSATWRLLLPVLGAVAMISAAVAAPQSPLSRALSSRWPVWIGERSYAWYLWHYPALVIGRSVLGDSVVPTAAMVIVSLAAAALSYRFVETPIRRQQVAMSATRNRSLAAAAIAILLMIGVGFGGRSEADTLQSPYESVTWLEHHCTGTVGREFEDQTSCRLGPPDAKIHLLLFGDSYARAFAPMVDSLGKMLGFSTALRMYPACSTFADTLSPLLHQNVARCMTFVSRTFKEMQATPSPYDGVIIANRWSYALATQPRDSSRIDRFREDTRGWSADSLRRLANEELRLMFARLANTHQRVMVLAGTPEWRHAAFACRRLPAKACTDSAAVFQRFRQPVFDRLRAETTERGYWLLDFLPAFCTDGICHAEIGGEMQAMDSHHISISAALRLTQNTSCAFAAFVSNRPKPADCPVILH